MTLPETASDAGKTPRIGGAIGADVANILNKLTEAHIFLILHGNRPPAFMKELCITWRQLQRRGLVGDVTLTPLGLAVRQRIRDSRP